MTERSVKSCTKSGQWAEKDGLEWTDYTPCLNKQVFTDNAHTVANYYYYYYK